MATNKKSMPLGTKLKVGFAVPLLMLLLIVVGVRIVATETSRNASSTGTVKYARLATQMRLDIVQVQQWLTDISATRAKDGLNDGFDEAANHAESFLSGLAEFRSFYESSNDSENLRQIDELKEAFAAYYEVGKRMAQGYIDGGPEVGNKMMADFDEAAATLAEKSGQFIHNHTDALDQALASIVSSSGLLQLAVTIVGAGALVVGVLMTWLITRSIMGSLNSIMGNLNNGAEQVASASNQVSSASQSLAEGSTEQAAGLEETSSSLEEMASMTKQNADNAQQANTLASEARKAADNGSESMAKMNGAIEEIQKSSDETAKIIKVIDEIAFQTNLLALNAAVEAARAGEAGKGFAVVAEEVRNLAMRSAEAAKNTANMIEESVKNSKNGVDIATEVGKALEEIVSGIGKTSELVSEIAAASSEQAQGIDQINTAMAQMDKVTQQNAANAEESASASEELSAQAEQMNGIVNQLADLVGGNSQNVGVGKTAESRSEKQRRFGKSDHVFHQVASGQVKRAETKVAVGSTAEKMIPLDDEGSDDFKEFNS